MTTYHDVVNFLADELNIDPAAIGPHTRLRQDLGINVDTADELVKDFSYTFRADISSFRINDYFGPDSGVGELAAFFLGLFGNAKRLKTLTVAELARAAEKRKL
jgi:hypothetical protein